MKTQLDYKHLNFDTRHDIEEEYAGDKSGRRREFALDDVWKRKDNMYACKNITSAMNTNPTP